MSDTTDPTAGGWEGGRLRCTHCGEWGHLNTPCPATPDAGDEFPMMVTEAKLHTTSNTGDMDALAKVLHEAVCGFRDACCWTEEGGTCAEVGPVGLETTLLASDWLADRIAAAERRGATQRAQKIAAAMETESHTHRPDRPIWLHAARIALDTR